MKIPLALSAVAIGVALTIGVGASVLPAQAAYVVDLTQVADATQPLKFDVVATGSGSLDLGALNFFFDDNDAAGVWGVSGLVAVGPPTFISSILYTGITGPSTIGPGGIILATSGSGNLAGIDGGLGIGGGSVIVSSSYVSGAPLGTSTDTWDNATFSSLGLTPGTYKWTWGSAANANADSFTVHIGTIIPEPSTWAMILLGFAGISYAGYRRRCSAVAVAQ
jgi:hypothetical protein